MFIRLRRIGWIDSTSARRVDSAVALLMSDYMDGLLGQTASIDVEFGEKIVCKERPVNTCTCIADASDNFILVQN